MYDGEVIAKAEEMGKPGLVSIKQKQVRFTCNRLSLYPIGVSESVADRKGGGDGQAWAGVHQAEAGEIHLQLFKVSLGRVSEAGGQARAGVHQAKARKQA